MVKKLLPFLALLLLTGTLRANPFTASGEFFCGFDYKTYPLGDPYSGEVIFTFSGQDTSGNFITGQINTSSVISDCTGTTLPEVSFSDPIGSIPGAAETAQWTYLGHSYSLNGLTDIGQCRGDGSFPFDHCGVSFSIDATGDLTLSLTEQDATSGNLLTQNLSNTSELSDVSFAYQEACPFGDCVGLFAEASGDFTTAPEPLPMILCILPLACWVLADCLKRKWVT